MNLKKIYFLLLLSFAVTVTKAQVLINEFSCSNLNTFVDNHSDYNDWIELHNNSGASVNIGGYYLSDDSLDLTKWAFPAGTTIAANGYLRVWASKRNETISPTNLHTNFTLKQTKNSGEYVMFCNASAVIVDYIFIQQKTQLGHSYGRVTNGNTTWGVFTTPTPGASNNSSTPYVDYADRPDFSIAAGFYTGSVTVAISTSEPASVIRYTLDGTVPTAASPTYSAPISITSTKILKAITYSANVGILPSFVEFNTYFINVSHTLPVVSIAGNSLTSLANGNGSLEPHGTFEYFNLSQTRSANTYGEFNKHGQDSWANSPRSLDFVSRDEMGYNHSVEEQLFQTTTMNNFQRVILRAAGDDNYPADHHPQNDGSAHVRDAFIHNVALDGNMNIEVRRGAKCIVYLNAAYWGVYDLRDNPDNHDNTEFYYGQDKYHLYMLKRWGSNWAEYGGTAAFTEWNALYNYIMTNNMANPANFAYVDSRFDYKSLVDYVILNMFTVCSDWLNWNTCWWRGLDSTGTHLKWGYQLWDNDATYGHYINYTGIPNTNPDADPCDPEGLNGSSDPDDHIGVLNKLRQNPDVNQYYIGRQLDLWNTVFSCDNLLPQLDSTYALLDPEMTAHGNRWAGTYLEWTQNAAELRNFIVQRCTSMTQGWISCYNLNGPYDITLLTDPTGAGSINLNSLTLNTFPWTGTYFGGMDTKLDAIANPNYQFIIWSSTNQVFVPNTAAANARINLNSNDTVIAHFVTLSVDELNGVNGATVAVYPTLISDQTLVDYYLPEAAPVSIKLYTVTGEQVMGIEPPHAMMQPGSHSAKIDISHTSLSQGIYMLEFRAGSFKKTIKLVYNTAK